MAPSVLRSKSLHITAQGKVSFAGLRTPAAGHYLPVAKDRLQAGHSGLCNADSYRNRARHLGRACFPSPAGFRWIVTALLFPEPSITVSVQPSHNPQHLRAYASATSAPISCRPWWPVSMAGAVAA